MRRWIRSSGSRPVAASETTHTRVRVLRSRPGRAHSAPNTFSVATSMNVRMIGSWYVEAFTRSTYLSPSSWRRISLPFLCSSLSAIAFSLGGDARRLPPGTGTEEPALGPAVGVVVVGDVAHVIVDVALAAEHAGGDLPQQGVHVALVLGGWLGAVVAPHHHGHVADVALRDPADVVLVVPGRDLRRPAQVASADAGEGGGRS